MFPNGIASFKRRYTNTPWVKATVSVEICFVVLSRRFAVTLVLVGNEMCHMLCLFVMSMACSASCVPVSRQ